VSDREINYRLWASLVGRCSCKNQSTDVYRQKQPPVRSPLDENIFYTLGADDGLIHILRKKLNKVDNIPGVPERTYVNRFVTS
jgi:hypothetical protein